MAMAEKYMCFVLPTGGRCNLSSDWPDSSFSLGGSLYLLTWGILFCLRGFLASLSLPSRDLPKKKVALLMIQTHPLISSFSPIRPCKRRTHLESDLHKPLTIYAGPHTAVITFIAIVYPTRPPSRAGRLREEPDKGNCAG